MKYIILVAILFLCGFIGYVEKNKYKDQKECLEYIQNFVIHLHINISVYKNNVTEIIKTYLINQKNKSAKFENLFQINNKIATFNLQIIDKYIFDKSYNANIKTFFNEMGKGDIEFECRKIQEFQKQVDNFVLITKNELKTKGELAFKLWLAIGVVIDIVIW